MLFYKYNNKIIMIKNWLVKTKQIKKKKDGFINHYNYLLDTKRASHKNTNIFVLEEGGNNILNEIEKRKEYRKKNSLRGGGVSNYATSFVLSLPKDIKQPNNEEWKKIGLYGIKQIAKELNIDFKKLRKISHIVLHEEKDKNKNNHIHILIGNVLDNKQIKGLTQYKSTHTLKKSFNYSVKKLLNEDNSKYMPKSKGKNLPLNVAREEKQLKILEQYENIKNNINEWFKKILNDKNAYLKSKEIALKIDKLEKLEDKKENIESVIDNIKYVEDFELNLKDTDKITKKTKRLKRRRMNKK